MRTALTALFILLPTCSFASFLNDGFSAVYEVSKNGMVLGKSRRQLIVREQGQILDYAATTTPSGLVAVFVSDRFMEHSLMQRSANGIRPLRYEYQRTGGKKEITFKANFDWDKNQIHLSNQPAPQATKSNSHDLLSFQLAIMQGLAQGQRQFNFHVLDHKRIQLQKLSYSKTEAADSSYGPLQIVRLDHQAEKSRYHFSFWCAKELNYLPVKIVKTEHDGDIIQLSLKSFNKKAFYLDESRK